MARLDKKKLAGLALPALGIVGGVVLARFMRRPSSTAPPSAEEPPAATAPELEEQLQKIDATIAELEQQLATLDSQVSEAQQLVGQQDNLIAQAKAAVAQLRQTLQEKQLLSDQLAQQLQQIEAIISELDKTNAQLTAQLTAVQEQIKALQQTVEQLKQEVACLRKMLELVPARVSVASSGTHARAGSNSAGFTLPSEQEITVTGILEAAGSWPFGCCNAAVFIRDRAGKTIKSWSIINACGHLVSIDSRRQPISEKVKLPKGMYSIQTNVWGTGGGGGASVQVDYQTARFLVENITCPSISTGIRVRRY